MRAVYLIPILLIATAIIVVQCSAHIWNFNPVCENLEEHKLEQQCTAQKQFIDAFIEPDKQSYAAAQQPAKQRSLIVHFLHGLHAKNDCEKLSENAKQQELSQKFQSYGCSVRKSFVQLMEKAHPLARKVLYASKDATQGLYAALVQDKCKQLAEPHDVDIKSRFQNAGCKIRKVANGFHEVARPVVEKILFTSKEASLGLHDAFTADDCEQLTQSSDSRIKASFKIFGCTLRGAAVNVGKATTTTIGITVNHINNIVKDKYNEYRAKYYKKTWTEKTADSMRNVAAIVANQYTLLKQTLGIEDVVKETTWVEKLLTAAKDSGSLFQQKFDELKKTINL